MSSFLRRALPAWEAWVVGRIQANLDTVKQFLDTTLTYVLSREWHDLIATYIFRLHPVPHCTSGSIRYSFLGLAVSAGGTVVTGRTCTADADSGTQAIFTVGLLVVASMVQSAFMYYVPKPHVTEQVTSVAGMCVGWAAGDAAVKLLRELEAASISTLPSSGGGGGGAAAAAVGSSSSSKGGEGASTATGTGGLTTSAGRLLLAIDESSPSALDEPALNRQRLLFAVYYSLATLLIITLLHPLVASPAKTAKRGGIFEALSYTLLSLWGLITRALTTSVLMIWTYASQTNLQDGLLPSQYGTELQSRILLLWAALLTFAGAAITIQLLKWRDALTAGGLDEYTTEYYDILGDQSDRINGGGGGGAAAAAAAGYTPLEGKDADDDDTEAAEATADGHHLYEQQQQQQPPQHQSPQPARPGNNGNGNRGSVEEHPGGHGNGNGGGGTSWWAHLSTQWRPFLRLELRVAGVQALLLSEKVLSWIAGCAWTEVFFQSWYDVEPTPWSALAHFATSICLTFVAIGWMVLVGGTLSIARVADLSRSADKAAVDLANLRFQVENFFLVQSASFFVGWSWVVVLRDLMALSGQTRLPQPQGLLSGLAHSIGIDTVETFERAELFAFLKALIFLILAGPVLTVVLVWARGLTLRQVSRAGNSSKDLWRLLKSAENKDAELAMPLPLRLQEWYQKHRSSLRLTAAASPASPNALHEGKGEEGDGEEEGGYRHSLATRSPLAA